MERETLLSYRKLFPVTTNAVYLDHAGIAPISTRAAEAVEQCARQAAEHGAFAYPLVLQKTAAVRSLCARLLNAGSDEIAFVRNTSHGLSIVASGLDWRPGDNVMIFGGEFPSNLFPWMHLAARGVEARIIAPREGRIVLEDIEAGIDTRTRLVAVSSVRFSNGFRIDLDALGTLCRSRNALLCVDAIQSLGALQMDVKRTGIDFLSADAHKWLLGPEGIGIFYCRRELCEQLSPPLIGWKSVRSELAFDRPELALKKDALRFEEGSMNLLGIAGLGAAVELLMQVGIGAIEERVLDLGDRIIEEAKRRNYTLLTPDARNERGGIVTIAGPFAPEEVRDRLRERGVLVNVRGGGIRISPHFYNTEEDVRRCFEEIATVAADMRSVR